MTDGIAERLRLLTACAAPLTDDEAVAFHHVNEGCHTCGRPRWACNGLGADLMCCRWCSHGL